MIRRRFFALLVLAFTTRCAPNNALEDPVQAHCIELATRLNLMAQDYDARAKIVDQTLSPEQQRSADAQHGIIPFDRRYVVIQDLSRDLGFCELVRKQDEHALQELNKRTATAFAAYTEAMQLTAAATALHDLSAIATETSHLPLK